MNGHIYPYSQAIPPHVVVGESPDCFKIEDQSGINLVVWQRPEFYRSIASAIAHYVQSATFLKYASSGEIIRIPGRPWGYPVDSLPTTETLTSILKKRLPGLEFIASDLNNLFKIYARYAVYAKAISAEIRLEFLPPRTGIFHTDFKRTSDRKRLVTSYYGLGPEWLDNEGISPQKIASSSSFGQIYAQDDSFIHPTETGDVCLIWCGEK